ncbi:MAG: O-antigen ligase domain-containing protein [Bacteroidetes bacterium]|nr:MAG: O-antigen ligase domain-containing protein [Bacteroidota bacterium]
MRLLDHPLAYVMLFGLAVVTAFGVSVLPLKFSALLVLGAVGVPLVVLGAVHLTLGLVLMLVVAFGIGLAAKYTTAPLGISMDALLALLVGSMLVRVLHKREFGFARSPISWLVFIWIHYNLLQVFNPWAESQKAWLYTIRSVALLLSLYFVGCYTLRNLQRIKIVVKTIVILTFIAALYGLKQEWWGFTNAEWAWLNADAERFMLFYQWGRMRIFSFFSDPTTYGILMGYMSIFCFVLATAPLAIWKRVGLIVAGVAMWLALAYSGSRTPVVMVAAGLAFVFLLTLNRQTLIAGTFLFLLGAAFMMKSTSNPVIYRVQSAFRPAQDASVQVRLFNQKRIQPFVQRHPFGAGLGSTGFWAKRFSPHSWLANFAHDSQYVRLAVETGWVGLLIYMALLLAAAQQAIFWFFRCHAPFIRRLYLAIAASVFMLILGSYPQEAITLPPTSIIFYILLAVIVKLKDCDTAPSEEVGTSP